jgi:DNA-binding transcriptional MerR regulator
MSNSHPGLVQIGHFARLTGLSLKALRLYDQLGLLPPARVDPESGYRYYSEAQVRSARLIGLLRRLDMPLTTIRHVVRADPAEAERRVLAHLQALETQLAAARGVAHLITQFLRQEITPMSVEVEVKTLPTQPILSLTGHVKVDQLSRFIDESIGRLFTTAGGMEAAAGPPFGIYHGPINQEDDGPIEVCLPVAALPAVPADGVTARDLSGGRVASVTMLGAQCEFPAILEGYDTAYHWMEHNGYEPADSPREIWHSPPGADARMEISWPFREKASA